MDVTWWDALSDGELLSRLEQRIGPIPPATVDEILAHRDTGEETRLYLSEVLS